MTLKPVLRLKISKAYDELIAIALDILALEVDVLEAYWKMELTGVELIKYADKQLNSDGRSHPISRPRWTQEIDKLKCISFEFFTRKSVQTRMWQNNKLTDLEYVIEMLKKWRSVV